MTSPEDPSGGCENRNAADWNINDYTLFLAVVNVNKEISKQP